jgi:hypothetical protein
MIIHGQLNKFTDNFFFTKNRWKIELIGGQSPQ